MKKYVRSVVEEFPHAAAEGYHVFGWRGIYLAICAFVFRRQPFSVALPFFGRVDSWNEATNLIDNFALGELRSTEVETHLRRSPNAWVVDVGVNVGVTCRWWLSLAPNIRVAGIDMFQEALEFTTEKITQTGQLNRWHPVCGAVGDENTTVEVRFTDPLEGTSSLRNSTGEKTRLVQVRALDELLRPLALERIGLLKVDIEGSAGQALRGAPETLSMSDYVTVETHSDDETRLSSAILMGAGFQLFRVHGRTMWWARD